MSNKNSQIILEDNRNDFSFKKNKSNINISFNRVSFIFFIFFIIFIIFSIHLVHLGSRDSKKIINENFDLSPRGIREMLKLNNPIYEVTSAYGHFGRKATNKGEFTWEKTDKVNLFKL